MLNAIVSTKDNSTVIEFPIDLYELYRQLNQNGVTQGPHRINIVDDENADVRVKLYSDSEFGNHIIRLMSEKDTLEDLHTVVGAINIAPDEVKEELEEYILYDQLNDKEELYSTLRELKESIAPIVTTFFCPLTAKIHDDEYGEMYDADDRAIRNAQYEIQEAIEKEQTPDFDMADCITDHPTANKKLVSAVWSVEEINGVLYGKIDCRSAEPFTSEEIEALKDGISGQNSDGLCEGFEQREIKTDEGDMYVSFWHSGDDYYIRTKEEMEEALYQGMKMEGM